MIYVIIIKGKRGGGEVTGKLSICELQYSKKKKWLSSSATKWKIIKIKHIRFLQQQQQQQQQHLFLNDIFSSFFHFFRFIIDFHVVRPPPPRVKTLVRFTNTLIIIIIINVCLFIYFYFIHSFIHSHHIDFLHENSYQYPPPLSRF